ncbi:MAG: hypothetical protein K6A23_06210 [Butyrivibrio sp.]|nr:hypothetical protein [Butyrivibrio sp.]
MQLTKLDILKILNNICMTFMLVWMIQTYYLDATKTLLIGNLSIVVFIILNDTLFVNSGKLFLYTLGRIIAFVILVILANLTVGFGPRVVVAAACILISYYGYMTGNDTIYPKLPIIFYYVALYVIGYFTGNHHLYLMALIFVIVTAVLAVILYNEFNMQRHFLILKGQNMVPYDQISSTNRMMVIISCIITVVMSLIAIAADYGEKIYETVSNAVIAFLTWLFAKLPKEPDLPVVEENTQHGGVDYAEILKDIPQKENKFLDAFWHAMTIAMFFVTAIVVIFVVYKIAIAFYRKFNEAGKKQSRDKTVFLSPKEERKKEKSKAFEDRTKIPFWAGSPDMRIRKMYFKYIKKLPGAGDIKNYHTPRQLELVAKGSTYFEENREEDVLWKIHTIYEKARYNPDACTGEDVAQMKNYIAGKI